MAERVRINEVGPRDGLQNEPGVIPTAEKVRLVELCAATGVDEVEVTSFVSPKWVPQLGDGGEVFAGLKQFSTDNDHPMFSALVPNEKGMLAAEDVARTPYLLDKVSVFTAASETFAKKNINATIAESLERFEPIVEMARQGGGGGAKLLVRGYISCVIACPFEGPIAPPAVADVARRLLDLGVDEIDLGDTIGAGTPETVRAMLKAVFGVMGFGWSRQDRLTLHLHDTFGHAAECVKAALDLGVRSFDGSVAGLGGCPYASTPGKRAPGNISTETLVRTIHAAGFETGVDLDKLAAAADYAREIVARSRSGGGGAP
jgi:hydroxymethylglutaryl-CoA lyase